MNEMLGIKYWDQKVIKVVREQTWVGGGRTKLVGEVKVQFSSDPERGMGRKLSGHWEWYPMDTIYLSSCVSTGKKSNIELKICFFQQVSLSDNNLVFSYLC